MDMSALASLPRRAAKELVQIYSPCRDIRSIQERIEFSRGTISAAKGPHRATHSADAFVPRGAWTPAQIDDVALLWTDTPPAPQRSVGLLQILEPTELSNLQEGVISNPGRVASDHPFVVDLLGRLKRWVAFQEDAIFHGIVDDPIGLTTVSYDPAIDSYVGLHIDTWDHTPASQRSICKVRICINIGLCSRYFLFIDRTVVGMFESLTTYCGEIDRLTPREIGKRFMSQYPDYPVIKLEVRPGEAYVAPAENILHDGSTLGVPRPVQHTAFRGHFRYCEPQRGPSRTEVTATAAGRIAIDYN